AFEQQLQRVAIVLIVVDDEDTGHIRCHEHLELSTYRYGAVGGSTVPSNAEYVLGTDLNCSESLGCPHQKRCPSPLNHGIRLAGGSNRGVTCRGRTSHQSVICGWLECGERLRPADQTRLVWCRTRCIPPRAPFRAHRPMHARIAR